MPKINILPFSVANLIAAGEVVDRPASVVKELMENAIDAGATKITVEIQHGGVTFLRVSDDGCGMEPEDLSVAVCRHATSKIRDASDLDGILTLGFRGEALAATAAVSEMRIISKVRENEFGAVLTVRGGEIVSLEEQGSSNGTTVIVENLFYNVPARRKFLKRDATEAMAVGINVEKIALSHPEIAIRFISDGAVKIETMGDGQIQSVIRAVFGKDFATRMIYVEGGNDGIRVTGCIARPDNVKANRNYQNYFLNGRYVRSKTACAAVEQAYVSFLPPDKFPACVLYITLNPTAVDVNVHPAKLEVKFSNEKPVFEAIYYTVRAALEENRMRPEMVLPVTGRNSFQRMTAEEYRKTATEPEKRVTNAFVPIEDRTHEKSQNTQMRMTMPVPESVRVEKPISPYRAERTVEINAQTISRESTAPAPTVTVSAQREESPTFTPVEDKTGKEPSFTAVNLSRSAIPEARQIAEQTAVIPEKTERTVDRAAIPEYRIIGEAFHSYVIVEKYDADNPIILLVDKHAAHERIIFEELKAGMRKNFESGERISQLLMLPVDFMLTASEIEVLNLYRQEIESLGFRFELGVHTVSVSEIPEGILQNAVADFFGVIAGQLLDSTGEITLTRDIMFEKALYQASCKAAVKAGREYADEHIEYIIQSLMKIPDITVCPHGRPVAMELSKKTIDRQFKRT